MRAIALAMGLIIAAPAHAQTLCGPRQSFIDHLGKNHGEAPTAMGLTSSGSILEVLTSEDGGWTIMVTRADGVSCLVATGEDWETIERVATDPES